MKLYLIIDTLHKNYYVIAETIEKAIKNVNRKIKENDEKSEIEKIETLSKNVIIGD